MEPREIFQLIVRADEKLKYAAAGREDVRRRQARELLLRALAAAREIGNETLVAQATTRLEDLGDPAS